MAAIRPVQVPQLSLEPDAEEGMDLWILVPTLALVALGVAMVVSATMPRAAMSAEGDVYGVLKRQVLFALLGLGAMYAASRIPLKTLERHAGTLLFVTAALLVAVLIPGVGIEVNGARSWFALPGGLRFQPSELAKMALVIAAARYFAKFPRGLANRRRAWPPFLLLAAVAGLVAVEPDMGTATIIVLSMMIYYHIAGAKFRHLLAAGAVGAAGAAVMVLKHPYQWQRIVGFINRTELPLDEGYQATQCLIALGSGGLAGRGYCGSVWKYFYLPAADTDSILAVVGEELGLLATWLVVALFAVLVYRGLQIAGRAPDRFSGLVAAGVCCVIGVQALLNVAVVTHSMPATGVPLPFVSYGGSSLVLSLAGIGLLLNVAKTQLKDDAPGEVT
ncbi:MAG: putative lipid II flippase FtsW [Armatimonadetes bacterium]|nr:putative lipid II flippase FtsW [Armatimonadota bacterium]